MHESEARYTLVLFWKCFSRKVLLCYKSGVFYFAVPRSCCDMFRNATGSLDINLSPFDLWGKIEDRCNSLRQSKEFHDHHENQSLFATFQEERSLKNCLNDYLMICLSNTFPKVHVKKSSSWKISSFSKEEVVHVHLHLYGIARNK